MTHETLVWFAKTVGLFWLMGFFLSVVILAYRPSKHSSYQKVAESILEDGAKE